MTRTLFAAVAVAVFSTLMVPAANAADSLRLLSTVSQAQAEAANEAATRSSQLKSNIQKRLDDTQAAIVQKLG